MKTCRLLALWAVLLSGCAALQLHGTVTQFHQLDAAPKSFVIMPMEAQSRSLEFHEYARLVKTELATKGWREATFETAAVAVFVQYSISSGRQVAFSYPILGAVPSGTSRTTGTVNTYRMSPGYSSSTFNATTTTGTTLGVVGTGVGSRTEFDRAVRIDIISLPEYRQTRQVVPLYEGMIRSTGRTGDMASVMPTLVRGLFGNFPGDSGATRSVSLSLTNVGATRASVPVDAQVALSTPSALPVRPANAAGLYDGTADASRPFTVLVVDSGRFYGLYGRKRGSGGLDAGFMVGDGTASGSTFRSTNVRDFFLEGSTVANGILEGAFAAQASVSGTIAYARGQRTSFTGGYSGTYDGTPSMGLVQGRYRARLASLRGSDELAVSVGASGEIEGTAASGCVVSGAISPYKAGNVYSVRGTLNTACPEGPQVLHGHGFLRDGTLYVVLASSDMNVAVRLIAEKQ